METLKRIVGERKKGGGKKKVENEKETIDSVNKIKIYKYRGLIW